MAKEENIVRYTVEEIKAMIARGEDQSDWARAGAMTDEEIEAAVASDPDEAGMVVDWSKAIIGIPGPKAVLHMRLDRDILDYFRRQGRGYQTKINAVLRGYVNEMGRQGRG